MNDIRRTLLWVAFTMSLLMLWDRWHVYNGELSMFAPRPVKTVTASAKAASAPQNAASGGLRSAASPGAAGSDSAGSQPTAERVMIQTDVVKATLDTRGGDLVALDLLKYQQVYNRSAIMDGLKKIVGIDVPPRPQGDVRLFDVSDSHVYVAQTGLMPDRDGNKLPYHRTVMTLVSPERTLAPGKNVLALRFESPEINGVQLVKTYTFHRGEYAVDVTHEVVNRSGAPVSTQLYLQLVRDGHVESGSLLSAPTSYTGPAVYTGGTFNKIDFEDIDEGKAGEYVNPSLSADNGWIAMIQHYFSSAWVLPQNKQRSFALARLDASAHGIPTYSVGMLTPIGTVAPGASARIDATLYAGPQEEARLAPLAPGLEQVKDYGILKIIAQPLFWLLDKLHTLIGNWGWSIVALVVLLKIAFYGLNASAYRSMAKMKAVNPRLQELRTRYKDKPQLMQQEMMKIYKEEKVNPLGGCLPILVQMPFFIALYSVLLSTAEMRGAPWIGWITDLSAMDPYAILPVLMLITSLLQVWFQPAPADPMQAKMMWLMPLVFSVMFFIFPSGLVLYWLTNNILSIAQQWFINRQVEAQTKK